MGFEPVLTDKTGLLIAQRLQENTAEIALRNARELCPLSDVAINATRTVNGDEVSVAFDKNGIGEEIMAAHDKGCGIRLVVTDTDSNTMYYCLPESVTFIAMLDQQNEIVKIFTFRFVNNSNNNIYGKPSRIQVQYFPVANVLNINGSEIA